LSHIFKALSVYLQIGHFCLQVLQFGVQNIERSREIAQYIDQIVPDMVYLLIEFGMVAIQQLHYWNIH